MDIIEHANATTRRARLSAQDIVNVSGLEYVSEPIPVKSCQSGSVTLSWAGLDGLGAVASLEVSMDGQAWNDIGDATTTATLNSIQDVQIWQIYIILFNYLRVRIVYNGATAGVIAAEFVGEYFHG